MPKATANSQENSIPDALQENRYYDIDQEEDEESRPGRKGPGAWRNWGRRLLIGTPRDHPFLVVLVLLQGGLIGWLGLRPAPPPKIVTRTVQAALQAKVLPPLVPSRPDPFAALPGTLPEAETEGVPAEPEPSAEPPGLALALTTGKAPAPVFGVPVLGPGPGKLSGPVPGSMGGPSLVKPTTPTTPEVTLRGIALYGKQRLAVLASGQEVIFKREGDALGDGTWQVARIDRDQVVAKTKTGEWLTLRLK